MMAPPPDPALGALMVVVTVFTHLVSFCFFAGRLYDRLVPTWRLSWDSYFLIAAVVRSDPPLCSLPTS